MLVPAFLLAAVALFVVLFTTVCLVGGKVGACFLCVAIHCPHVLSRQAVSAWFASIFIPVAVSQNPFHFFLSF
jgi:hypothetical protein